MTLVAAVISVCLVAVPAQCESHTFRIERSACGLVKRAEVPIGGQWMPATARIECGKS